MQHMVVVWWSLQLFTQNDSLLRSTRAKITRMQLNTTVWAYRRFCPIWRHSNFAKEAEQLMSLHNMLSTHLERNFSLNKKPRTSYFVWCLTSIIWHLLGRFFHTKHRGRGWGQPIDAFFRAGRLHNQETLSNPLACQIIFCRAQKLIDLLEIDPISNPTPGGVHKTMEDTTEEIHIPIRFKLVSIQ